jgi:hypothetical protein
MYGKIENNKLLYAPNTLIIDGKRIINPPITLLEQQRYKPIINTPYPDDGKHYKQGFEETENEIRIVWIDSEAEYWANVDYNTAVETEIAKRYSIQQELAIQRQKDEKPEEYEAYYAYCEECKAYVKDKKEVTYGDFKN